MARDLPFIAVYIMASSKFGTLYTGVTSDLWLRVWKHKHVVFEGFAKQYRCTGLVWLENHTTMKSAIQREKNIKHWVRRWKLDLIGAQNPD